MQRFFSQLSSRLCCQARLEKLNELKHEECYEKELSDAALAAASGAAPSENAGDDKRLTQFDERQLSDMIGELRLRIVALVGRVVSQAYLPVTRTVT